jgi:hypothetical protein
MSSNRKQVAVAIDQGQFRVGDRVILAEGPHKFTRGTFIGLRPDSEWAAIREPSGLESSHPVEWLRSEEKQNGRQ